MTGFVNASETVVDDGFELSDGVDVPAGCYRNDHLGWFASSSQARVLSLISTGMISRFYGGSLVSASATVTAAPSPQVTDQRDTRVTWSLCLPADVTADISSLRATYSFSTQMSTNVLIQYNGLEREFSTRFASTSSTVLGATSSSYSPRIEATTTARGSSRTVVS